MSEVDALFRNWQRLLAGDTAGPSAAADEFAWTAGELAERVRGVGPDVQDLEDTVAIVEQHPGKFALAAAELAERKRFIASVRLRLQVHARAYTQRERERQKGLHLCAHRPLGAPCRPEQCVQACDRLCTGAHGLWHSQEITNELNSPTTRGKLEKDKREVRRHATLGTGPHTHRHTYTHRRIHACIMRTHAPCPHIDTDGRGAMLYVCIRTCAARPPTCTDLIDSHVRDDLGGWGGAGTDAAEPASGRGGGRGDGGPARPSTEECCSRQPALHR
jgi:hypothetical protein